MLQGKEAGGEGAGAEGPDTPSPAPLRGPAPRPAGSAGAEGPDTQPRNGSGGHADPRALRCSHPYLRGPVPDHPRRRIDRVRTGWTAAGPLDAQVPRVLKCDSGTTRHTWREDLPNDQLVRWYWQLMRSVRWGWHQFYSHQLLKKLPVELGNPPILALILMRRKGCTVLRLRYQQHQCGALKSLG